MYNNFLYPYNQVNAMPPYYANNGANIPAINNGIIKVTGYDGAKAYQMGANQVAALFDVNENVFWIKSTDGAGFASYRKFRYDEENNETNASVNTDYVTRKEFDELKAEVENYGNVTVSDSTENAK